MSYYRGNIFSTIINTVFAVLIIYLLIQGLIFLVPIGIIAWMIYRVYKYFAYNKEDKREEEPIVSRINVNDELDDSEVIDVDYEDITK
ncbi:hypothetical protein SH2C18_16610 [Clostridium sediminicola]|uniref:hypothetical protein n=1 Tax=Clostridium sediminicola TaxID=3114879 RepID=UPI0031F1FF46